MILPLAALLLSLTAQGDDCLDQRDNDAIERYPDIPRQRHGPGLWIGGIAFAAADIDSIEPTQDHNLADLWGITIAFTTAGNAKFVAAQRCGVDRPIELSVDGAVISRPFLQEPILGGKMVLMGGLGDQESAEALTARLRRAVAGGSR